MGLLDIFKSKKKQDTGVNEFFDEMEAMMNEIKEKEGTNLDQLPGGKGEFGFSLNNPILLTDVSESSAYLDRLIYIKPGSSEYRWQRTGSMRSEIVSAPVDEYNLLDPQNNIVKTIYIWPYNKVNSKIVPEGFGLME
jgi:hypothetical protein